MQKAFVLGENNWHKIRQARVKQAIDGLEIGDTFIIADLTGISRSTKDLPEIVDKIKNKGAYIKSLKDTWMNTTADNPYNDFLINVMSGLSQLERDFTEHQRGVSICKGEGSENYGSKNISEEEFRERVLVENDIEPLYFPYYEYVRKNPVTKWKHQTYILRGENDTLCEYAYVKSFADRFGCEMTVQKNGEHWFHTEEELDFFRNWLRERM